MQNPINKEIRHYQEEIFMGLTLRQLVCSGVAIGLAVLAYMTLAPLLGRETASWVCIVAAVPIAAAGFFHYDDLNFEQFLVAVVESVILGSSWRLWKTEYDLSKPKLHVSGFDGILECHSVFLCGVRREKSFLRGVRRPSRPTGRLGPACSASHIVSISATR